MYLNRGRSSRFKLLKLVTLSHNLKRVNKCFIKHTHELETSFDPDDVEPVHNESYSPSDEITLEDSSTFVSNFSEFSGLLNSRLLKSLESNGFVKLTPIQKLSIPKVLKGSTVLIRSASGTGKTLTFVIPALQKLVSPPDNVKITRKDGTKVLIITPTRELSFQISKVTESLSKPFPWIVVSCIKGISRKSEKARIRKGITIVIGTPGRILDHMESTSSFNLTNMDMLVLDEADRLLDMGFENKIRNIHSHLLDSKKSNAENAGIQIVLTSATITDRVTKLVDTCFVAKPLLIGVNEENHKMPTKLNLEYALVDCNNKFMCLVSMLLKFVGNHEKILIFVSNCDTVNYMERLLKMLSWPSLKRKEGPQGSLMKNTNLNLSELEKDRVLANKFAVNKDTERQIFEVPIYKLHGDMESKERMPLMDQFINSKSSIMVSTDVASRGLNLSKVNRVVQYDPPQQLDEFIHRSGRTARIGDSGTCLLILMKHESEFVQVLNRKGMKLKEIGEGEVWNPIKNIHTPKYLKNFKGDLVGFMRNRFCTDVKEDSQLLQLAKNAFKSSIRSYKTYAKELRKAFNFRRLHLGHYATSFCLNMKPTELMSRKDQTSTEARKKRAPKMHSDRRAREPKLNLSAESQSAAEMALKYLKEKNMIL
ncbi:DEAD-box family helicase [Theileria orientalis strain Shintoku]|uniref:ATP-dependent RNA helicase n=1 Tax=Theileria orientalis strain Shintoku TaxID=869250 RepID=J4CCF8_THEOR|nr:DEAD-box family helicase [Theileria orientalis strain Shintoku]BAM39317.1 DEAD-box family helicase [Theileria orientalis strain Shintoku]|eukprot:XP_009689618.1 DEAD-box family helicase [Theileria orientalis strain Shintoku]